MGKRESTKAAASSRSGQHGDGAGPREGNEAPVLRKVIAGYNASDKFSYAYDVYDANCMHERLTGLGGTVQLEDIQHPTAASVTKIFSFLAEFAPELLGHDGNSMTHDVKDFLTMTPMALKRVATHRNLYVGYMYIRKEA